MPAATLSRTATGAVVPDAVARARPRVRDEDRFLGWVGTIAVTALAAFLRLWHLGYPRAFLFDETYYAKDAWSLVHHGYVTTYAGGDKVANPQILAGHVDGLWTNDPSMVVHPEVAKWIIGAGELVFGMDPFGWRVASALVGALMVMVMVRLTRRVTGSTLLGVVGGLLMCCDGLQLVLSRLALLDIFVAFFVLCAVSCMVADRDWFRERLARRGPVASGWGPRVLGRPWLLLAGLWWGLALGTKWAALFPLAALGLLFWAWCSGARRSFGVRRAWLRSALADALPGLGYLVLLPFVVYVLTWTGWLLHADAYEQHLSHTQYGPAWGSYLDHDAHGFLPETAQSLRSLWHYHHDVYAFHDRFLNHSTHTYQSKPVGWIVLNRPVGVDAQLDIKPGDQGCDATGSETCLRQILLLGTPLLWWFSAFALVWSAVSWVGRRDWRYGLVTVGTLATWLPWLRYDDRPIFSYYAILTEPFLVLGAVLLLGEILGRAPAGSPRRTAGALAAGAVVVGVVAMFAWFWPVYTDGLLTQSEWVQRIWFRRWI